MLAASHETSVKSSAGIIGFLLFSYSYVHPINDRWYEETYKWQEDSIIDSLWIRIATAWLRQAWSISYQFKFISHRWQRRLWDFQPIMTIIDSSLLNANWISKNAHNPRTPHYLYYVALLSTGLLCLFEVSFGFLLPFSKAVDFPHRSSFCRIHFKADCRTLIKLCVTICIHKWMYYEFAIGSATPVWVVLISDRIMLMKAWNRRLPHCREKNKQINKYKNNIFTILQSSGNSVSLFSAYTKKPSYRQVALPISCRLVLI